MLARVPRWQTSLSPRTRTCGRLVRSHSKILVAALMKLVLLWLEDAHRLAARVLDFAAMRWPRLGGLRSGSRGAGLARARSVAPPDLFHVDPLVQRRFQPAACVVGVARVLL